MLCDTRDALETHTRNARAALTILAVLREASEVEVARLRLQAEALTAELGNAVAELAVSEKRARKDSSGLVEENKRPRRAVEDFGFDMSALELENQKAGKQIERLEADNAALESGLGVSDQNATVLSCIMHNRRPIIGQDR